ncbi:PREDICTED: putative F-box/kelch-repeat protein At2g29800 [Camelina sativa]|uniref:F-box/kelch-repeat protein At2g29800 n=1 Tax=Camelina sativa TaxID=90675 RepID=A0ABM1R3I9_CAMSA|nr:PREDICTED: putative F-box/kelch-repeat protein At2g29800 [Camelina sativa]XP_019093577.1 PREDICTED: putative F-box/kelch-repeat protein At2g29800 [Camelina sativa]
MVVISTTSDDGSNGGDPTKIQKGGEEQEDNQNKNPKEEDDQEVDQNLAPIRRRDIPVILIESTVALIRRCHYPRLSLVSKAFRDVISSDQLFVTRSLLGLTEPVLYTLIRPFPRFEPPRWYILHRSNMSLRLSRISSLPPMYPGCTAVTIGRKIYVMGGLNVPLNRPVRTLVVIDCRSHTYRQLQSMKRDRCFAASGVIDGKIYVVGGREKRYYDWVEVFDVETETWETVPAAPFSPVASSISMFPVLAVLDNKIYIMDRPFCLVYDPRLRRWEDRGPTSPQRLFWHASSCVVDDLLYVINVPDLAGFGSSIIVYDPRDMVWRPVKGVDLWPALVYIESRMVSFGGKLVILGYYNGSRDVAWCVEVALEKREDGDIWGKFESISRVCSFGESCLFEIARTVTV